MRTRALGEGHPFPGHLTKQKGMDGMLLQPLLNLFFFALVVMVVLVVLEMMVMMVVVVTVIL